MHYSFQTSGVCARSVEFDIDDGVLSQVSFTGGCNGNLKAIGKLTEGRPAEEVMEILAGNTCGYKNTSCADQLSKAIEIALNQAS